MSLGHILFIDDDMSIREIGRQNLQTYGYKVSTAINALKAIEMLGNQHQIFDLIITDFQMPGMNGLQLATHIRSMKIQLPIILSTGSKSITEKTMEDKGIDALLRKPYELKEMNRVIQEVLRKTM